MNHYVANMVNCFRGGDEPLKMLVLYRFTLIIGHKFYSTLADSGGGALNGRGPVIFVCQKKTLFLSSLEINFKHSFKRTMTKTR